MGLSDYEVKRLWRNKDLPPKKMIQCIAELSACEYMVARNRCEALGLIGSGQYMKPDGVSVRWTGEQTKQLMELWKTGISTEVIAKRMNRTKRSIDSKIGRMRSDGSIFQY